MPQAATVPHGKQPSPFAAASPSKQITCCARGRQAHRFRTELQKRLSVAAISGGSLSLWKLLRDRRRRIQPLRLRTLSRLLPCGRAPGRSSVVENHRRPADPTGLDAIRFPEDHVSHQGKGHSFRCNRHHHQGTKDRCHPPRRRVAHNRRWDWRTDSREQETAMKDHRDCPVADTKRRSILALVRTGLLLLCSPLGRKEGECCETGGRIPHEQGRHGTSLVPLVHGFRRPIARLMVLMGFEPA
jgi:hypothetical protein